MRQGLNQTNTFSWLSQDAMGLPVRKPDMHRQQLWAVMSYMFDVRRNVLFPNISLYTKRLNQSHRVELVFPHWPVSVKDCQKFFRMKLIRVKVMTEQIIPTIPVPWPQKKPHPWNPPRRAAAKPRAGVLQRLLTYYKPAGALPAMRSSWQCLQVYFTFYNDSS